MTWFELISAIRGCFEFCSFVGSGHCLNYWLFKIFTLLEFSKLLAIVILFEMLEL